MTVSIRCIHVSGNIARVTHKMIVFVPDQTITAFPFL